MATRSEHSAALALARRQHHVISYPQLHAVGFTRSAIRHCLSTGRFHLIRRGVVAIGRPDVGLHGHLTAAVLVCPDAAISHTSAALLWELVDADCECIHLSVPAHHQPRARGVVVHRRDPMPRVTKRHGISVTQPLRTLIDLAVAAPHLVESAVNEADRLGLLRMDQARKHLARGRAGPGTRALTAVLERHTVTDSQLEQRFLRIVRDLGLPAPRTQERVNGFKVDFYWPEFGLVVETDGLTYHRTPRQQAKDRRRDQVHTAAGLVCLRFTNAQIRRDPRTVASVLTKVAVRLGATVRKRSL